MNKYRAYLAKKNEGAYPSRPDFFQQQKTLTAKVIRIEGDWVTVVYIDASVPFYCGKKKGLHRRDVRRESLKVGDQIQVSFTNTFPKGD